MSISNKNKGVTRREFMKGAAVGTAAVAGGGLLVGSGVEAAPLPQATGTELASFEIAPEPIPASDIAETITADVIVIGAGISGLTAAVSAAEAGAKTILLEKGLTYTVHGLHNAAVNSRMQEENGIHIDRDEIISTIMQYGSYRSDQRVVSLWADKSAEVMNWLLDMAEAANIEVVLDPTTKEWYFQNYPTIHVFMPGKQATLAQMLQSKAEELGVDLQFETPVVRLLREGNGRVTGVIAESPEGDYVQYNANKAVVLCTGDYGADPEMIKKYCDWRALAGGLTSGYTPAVNTGDGHKMALWIGAAMDDPPHCVMYFDTTSTGEFLNLARQPWLYVNVNGERFMNEDLPWGYECCQILQQPGAMCWAVWDEKYDQEWPIMKSQCCKNMGEPTNLWAPQQLTAALESGLVLKADTLEDLAAKMEVPVETFVATTTRYTEMAKAGQDLDYGKHHDRLTTLEKAPFYACKMTSYYLVTLGGLKVNTDLQVLDTERNPIPGLYAAGNASGCFFGDMYPTTTPGLSHGRAWTFGRIAGLNAAAEQV